MTFKKHLAVIFAITFICLSGCSNSTQATIAAQPESSAQDMSKSDPSVEATETDIISNTNADSEDRKLQVETSSQDMHIEKVNSGVRIFVDSNYYDLAIDTNNTELDYGTYKFFLQDMVSKDGVRYILFSYSIITIGRGMGIEFNYLLLRAENNQLIPVWTNRDITLKTAYADDIFSVKIGDYPDEYKIDIASRVKYENQLAESFKPLSVEDIFNGSTHVICYDVHIDSQNQIVTNFLCNSSDYLFYITSIKLVWSMQNNEMHLEQCSLVDEIPN